MTIKALSVKNQASVQWRLCVDIYVMGEKWLGTILSEGLRAIAVKGFLFTYQLGLVCKAGILSIFVFSGCL